jgi:8-oxo-dGTP pyrophosphatase MutT (NUDIX family)
MDEIAVFPVATLDLRFEPAPWPFAHERRAEIDAYFAQQRARNPTLWNGRILLMRRWTADGGAFRGAYTETDFASLLAWRDFGFPDRTMFNCYGMAALRSSDGAYLLGEMAAHTANAGRIYFPAGTPEPEDIIGDTVDLAGNVMRELAEETGLAAGDVDVDVSEGWTCVRVGQRIGMMREMRAREPAEDLRRHIRDHLAAEAHAELSDIRIVRGPADIDARMPPWITEYFRYQWS